MDRKTEKEDVGDIRQIASLCTPHPSGGLTGLVLMHRQVARFKEIGVWACMCVRACVWLCVRVCRVTWFSCSKPIAWPWSQRRGCVHECMWMWTSLFARLFLFPPPPQTRRGGRPWWMRSSCHICTHTYTHFHKRASTSTHASSMIQSDDGYWRGNWNLWRSQKSEQ